MTTPRSDVETGRFTRAQEPQRVGDGLTRDRATDSVLGVAVDVLEYATAPNAALLADRVRRLCACDHPHLPRIRAQAPGWVVVDAADGIAPLPRGRAVAVVEAMLPVLQALSGLHALGLVHGALSLDSLRVSADGAYVLADAVVACLCAPDEDVAAGQARDVRDAASLIATLCGRAAPLPLDEQVRRLPAWLRPPLDETFAARLSGVAALHDRLLAALPARGPVLWPVWSVPIVALAATLLVATIAWAVIDLGRPMREAGAAAFATPTAVPPPRAEPHAVQVSGRLFWGQTTVAGLTLVADSVGADDTASALSDGNGHYALTALTASALTFRLRDAGYVLAAPPAPPAGGVADDEARFTLDPPSFAPALQRLPAWTAVTTRTLAADFLVVRTDLIIEDVHAIDDQTLEVSWIPYRAAPVDALYRAIVRSPFGELEAAPFTIRGAGWGTVTLDLDRERARAATHFDPPRLWGRLPDPRRDDPVTVTVQVGEPYVDGAVTYVLPLAQGSRALTPP